MKTEKQWKVPDNALPTMAVLGDRLYLKFKPGTPVDHTVPVKNSPLVLVDVAENGEVLGIERIPEPRSWSVESICKEARVKIPAAVAARTKVKVHREEAAVA
ncbi:hypothetical protein OPIT5_16750 [Opitutaceae bacterium TAV5]|nr:hypothetical protein OPIT5_16750 [Opitutaceae bacterium TAV5]